MNDKIGREDFDKKLVLLNVMRKKNRIYSEMKLGNIFRFIYFCCFLFLKFKKKNSKNY